ncbi:MAG: antitoxin [Candidatus Dormibacteraeota bacterium]|nr:antitoxin [Candidatus Dormibacteraeota bacterium]
MRTTITLEPDVEALVRKAMSDRKAGRKQVVNEAIREGLNPRDRERPYRLQPVAMGEPLVPLVKALQLAGQLEDEEIIEKMRQGR